MGPDVVGPGTGVDLNNDDWFNITELVHDEHDVLNRSRREADALALELVGGPFTEVWAARNAANETIGFAALHLGRKRSDAHTASLRVHVRDEYRGRGYGARLIKAALKWADENGIERVTATPYLGQRANVGWFERFGFAPEGIARKGARLLDGTYVDVAQLARVK